MTTFRYDPLGRCVKRTINPGGIRTYLYYDGWNLIQEGPNSATADRIYAHGNRVDETVASQYGGAWRYHHYDARGHCILLTDASGGIVEQYDYDAFGKPYFYDASGTALPNGSSVGNRFLFTGREYLKDMQTYDFRNRLYQPELGRFIQPDPKEFDAGDYNLYRYCHNDPVNKSDSTGLEFYDLDPALVDAIPGKFGNTEFKLQASVGWVPTDKGFSLKMNRLDVSVTSKQIATTANGKQRSAEAVEATKTHENMHRDDIKKWHDENQNNVPKETFPTAKDAAKAAQDAASRLNRDFGRAQDKTNEHKPDSRWKRIQEFEMHY